MKNFHPRELKWIGVKFLDPIGRVFEFDSTYYRAIYPHKVAYTKKLLEAEFIRDLVRRRLLVGAEIAELSVEGYGMVLKHESCPFITRPLSWSREFLREAALCGIDLNLSLFEHSYGTIDLHTGNIQQIGLGKPVWIDWGSICPLNEIDGGAGSIVELKNYYLHPLHLLLTKPSLAQIVRHAMYHLGGINDEQFRELTGGSLDLPGANRCEQLLAIREQVALLRFPQKETQWGDYQQNAVLENPEVVQDARTRTIYEIMKRAKPKKYIDLSCSAGRFSFMAARLGAKVYAVDYDEIAIERLHATLRQSKESLSITTAMADVMKPHEVKADFATALALEHHLWLTQRFPVERIAEVFASYTTGTLLTEFMPFGLGSTRPVPDPLPQNYRLIQFVDAFRPWFEKIQIIYCAAPMSYSFRVLLFCSGKRNFTPDDPASVETVFAPFSWAAPDSFFRIICDHCGGVLATSSESSAHCPSCNTMQKMRTFIP
jgi:SAM-dependent methyltransferase